MNHTRYGLRTVLPDHPDAYIAAAISETLGRLLAVATSATDYLDWTSLTLTVFPDLDHLVVRAEIQEVIS